MMWTGNITVPLLAIKRCNKKIGACGTFAKLNSIMETELGSHVRGVYDEAISEAVQATMS